MEIKFVAFGIAKDIMGDRVKRIDVGDRRTVSDLKSFLLETYPQLNKLKHFHIAVNEEYGAPDTSVTESDEVVIIPPVSGG